MDRLPAISVACMAIACSHAGTSVPDDPSPAGPSGDPSGAATSAAPPPPASSTTSPTPAPPPPPPPPPMPGVLRIMTYNIKVGSASSLEAIATVIANEKPDIVGLEEVDDGTDRSGKVNQTADLAKQTGMPHAYFGPNFAYDGGQYGLAILSKQPLANTRVVRLDARTERKDGYEPRIAVAAETTFYGRTITFVAAGFVDAHYEKTKNPLEGLTEPAVFPTRRIDMVYKDAAFGPTEFSWVPNTTASDHRPVMVTFETPK